MIYIFIAVVFIFGMLCFLKEKKNISILKNLKIYLKGRDKKRILAWCIICFLTISDFFAIYEMFRSGQSGNSDSIIFALTFAICLEGFPTLLGTSLGTFISKIKSKKDDFLRSLIGCMIGIVGTALVVWLVFSLRTLLIEGRGGQAAFQAGITGENSGNLAQMEYYEEYFRFILDSFLRWSPILTSTLALFLSWIWLPNDEAENAKAKVDSLYHRLVYQTSVYEDALHKFQNARIKLWTLLCSDQKMPIRPDVYRYEVYNRMREKLFYHCLDNLDTEMMTYNSEIETLLQSYITELSQHSSIPDEILKLRLENIIQDYDCEKHDDVKWEYALAKDDIHKRLYASLKRDFDYLEYKTDMIHVEDYPEDY